MPNISVAMVMRERRVMEGRIESDFGVTKVPSFLTKRKLAPPVSSTYVRVAGSRNMFSSKPF